MVKKNENRFKYLVLDLDNTLIFCKKINTRKVVRRRFILRPYLFKFLNTLKQYYVLNIFTGGKREYAEKAFQKIKREYRQTARLSGFGVCRFLIQTDLFR